MEKKAEISYFTNQKVFYTRTSFLPPFDIKAILFQKDPDRNAMNGGLLKIEVCLEIAVNQIIWFTLIYEQTLIFTHPLQTDPYYFYWIVNTYTCSNHLRVVRMFFYFNMWSFYSHLMTKLWMWTSMLLKNFDGSWKVWHFMVHKKVCNLRKLRCSEEFLWARKVCGLWMYWRIF